MISVIIPTRNRADLLMSALDSLVYQNIPQSEFEIIVVNNGSTDNTPEVIRKKQTKLPNLHSLYEPIAGLHAGRHAGMKAAKGEILVFADDDIEAFPTWLAAIADSFTDPDVAMVGGNNLPMFIDTPPDWLQQLWDKSTLLGGKALSALSILELPDGQYPINPKYVWGCNFSIRKSVLEAAGGFNPDGMPKELIRFRGDGETYVSRYVFETGKKCMFNAGATVYHKVTPERMTYAYFRSRGFNQGVSNSFTELRNNELSVQKVKRNIFRHAVSRCLRIFKNIYSDLVINKAIEQLREGQKEGYAYHQKAYREDAEVRAWVHRENYYSKVKP